MVMLTSCAAKFGKTLIVITYDPELAVKADRVVHIEDGRVKEAE